MSRLLCWLGLHKWMEYFCPSDSDLMPDWFIYRRVCMRCGHDTPDHETIRKAKRGWRPCSGGAAPDKEGT